MASASRTGPARLLGADIARIRAITRKATIDDLKPARGVISGEGQVGMSRDETS